MKKYAIYMTHQTGRTYYQSKLFGQMTCLRANIWTTPNRDEAIERAGQVRGEVAELVTK